MKHLVVGSEGEVGQAIVSILKSAFKVVFTHDLKKEYDLGIKVDMIHICIPYTDNFMRLVLDYAENFGIKAVYVVIHSTVSPFTTRTISKIRDNIVYSPIRGKHPNLYTDLLTYTKYFASENNDAAYFVNKVFKIAGLKTKIVKDVSSLEFAKHYSTLLFGMSLVATQEVYGTKKSYGLNPAIIMDFVNDTGKYTGDRKIYPYIEKIGGHCVVENAKLFESFSTIANFMIRFNKLFGQNYPEKDYKLQERA